MQCTRRDRVRSSWRQASSSASSSSDDRSKYPRWLVGGEIPRVAWDDAGVVDLMRRGEPAVLTGGCPLVSGLVGRWDFAYLADAFGAFDGLGVHFTPPSVRSFTRHYARKGLGEGGVRRMTFRGFVDAVRDRAAGRDPFNYYLQCPLVWRDGADAHGEAREGEPLRKPPIGPKLEADLGRIGWEWLARTCAAAATTGFDTAQLWAGHGGSTPCHFDSRPNFLCQLVGRKRVLLFSPRESFRLYPHLPGSFRTRARAAAAAPLLLRCRRWC